MTKELIVNLTKILSVGPTFVLTITEEPGTTSLLPDDSISFTWITLANQSKVTITCPGCGTTARFESSDRGVRLTCGFCDWSSVHSASVKDLIWAAIKHERELPLAGHIR